ncbi:MAG: disulfide bond formation protein B [Rubrivivax sp.]
MTVSRSAVLAGIAGVALASVAAAVVSQHVFEMQPCPWCVLQRLVFVALGLVALLGLGWRSPTGQRGVPLLLLVLSVCDIAAALWQHFVAASSVSCNLTFADRLMAATRLAELLPSVFEPRATCADAAVDLAGVPYEFWSLAVLTATGVTSIALLLRKISAGRR